MSRNVGLGGFERYDSLREELLVLNVRAIFVCLCFCWNKKNTLIWYKVYVLRTRYVEKCWSDYLFLTWVENLSPASCGLVVPIVVSHVHQKRNRRHLMHREFNYACIRTLRFRLWWTWRTTIDTTSQKFAEDGFSTQVTHQ